VQMEGRRLAIEFNRTVRLALRSTIGSEGDSLGWTTSSNLETSLDDGLCLR
jgi:hypothetical protein